MIRKECLTPAESWIPPTADEITEIMHLISPELSGGQLAKLLGLGKGGGRTVRRWLGGETDIPYAVWCLMVYEAGQGKIWGNFEQILAAKV